MKQGALVSRRTFQHHRYRDNDFMLTRNEVEAGNGTGCAGPSPMLNTSTDSIRASGERAMLDYVMSVFNYSAPLEFCHLQLPRIVNLAWTALKIVTKQDHTSFSKRRPILVSWKRGL